MSLSLYGSHDEYFGNYAVSKAAAEKSVLDANAPDFRTGTIRPANGIYGNQDDHTVGTYTSWVQCQRTYSPCIINQQAVANVETIKVGIRMLSITSSTLQMFP